MEPGRQLVEGTLISERWQESQYGSTLKCLVITDDGRSLWGTKPTIKVRNPEGHYCEYAYPRVLLGARIQFMAQLERSDNDPHFGFFKRPTKAKMLVEGTREPCHD